MAKKHIAAGTRDYPARSNKTPTAQASIAAREARMNPQPMPEPVVSRSRHGRPADGALFAGGQPWTPYGGGKRYNPVATDNSMPSDIPGDCPGD